MKKFVSVFCGLSALIADCCAMAAVFTVLSIVEKMENSDPGLAIWLLFLSLCHVGLAIFLRRERNERALIFFCTAFIAAQAVLVFLIYGFFSSFIGVLAAVCMWLYSYYACYELAIKGIKAEKITKSFDLCSMALVFGLFFCSVKGLPLKLLLPLGLSTLLCLFALILIRGGEQRKLRSVFMSAALVLVLGIAAGFIVALASGGIKKVILFLTSSLRALLGLILRVIDAFFRFLAGLFPEKQYELLPAPEIEGFASGSPPDMSFELVDPEVVISVMIGLGLCIALAMIIYRIVRGKHFAVPVNYGGDNGIKRRRSGIAEMLKKAFARFYAAISFRISALVARNTVPGLFWQIERRSRHKLHGRGKSESCREFLNRAVDVYPWAAAELMLLAEAMDEICFGGGDGLGTEEIINIRRKIFSGENKETET